MNKKESRTKPTIISCAVTGSFTTREHNPALAVRVVEDLDGEIAPASQARQIRGLT